MRNLGLILLILCAGCGFSSKDNEVVGQIKRVLHKTPIFCPERYDVDLSLGVIKNGVGSMSSQDIWLTIQDPSQLKIIQEAAISGELVKLNYNVPRFVFCPDNDHQITHAELVK